MKLYRNIRDRFRRWKYREGRTLSGFVAKDIRRDILIVSAARVVEGGITGRVRTMNLLYRSAGLVPESEFGPLQELRLGELWRWTGQPWGGLPDGTSLATRLLAESQDAQPGTSSGPAT